MICTRKPVLGPLMKSKIMADKEIEVVRAELDFWKTWVEISIGAIIGISFAYTQNVISALLSYFAWVLFFITFLGSLGYYLIKHKKLIELLKK